MPSQLSADSNVSVTVVAPARLHMGFLDLGGWLGRRFGSIGVGINEIATRLTIRASDRLSAEGTDAERAVAAAEKLARVLGRPLPAAIRIDDTIPGHAGLGSGTQLGLAVGAGLSRLYNLALGAREIAPLVDRGARSGIGIAVFERGGLVVDGGRGPETSVPPVLVRLDVPTSWRFILVLDERDQGLHGAAEVEAFKSLPRFPEKHAARLCHALLMRGLPALAEGDIANFGAVITELQHAIGDYFAPAQGGRFTSPDVGEAVAFLESRGALGAGQSSWGPTGFCLVDSTAVAEALVTDLRERFGNRPGLRFRICSARNQGAEIRLHRENGAPS